MGATVIGAPILPGKTEEWREFYEEMKRQHRRGHEEARRQAGITREVIRLQRTPYGDVAVVYIEADDPQDAFRTIATSDHPFDRWFRERVLDVHGIDLTHALVPAEYVFEWQIE